MAVVALLDADIKVGIAVEGEEKFGDQLSRAVAVEPSGGKVGVQIRGENLVEPPDAVVIRAFAPKGIMQNPEKLERFEEGSRSAARNLRERFGDFGQSGFFGGGAVRLGETENRVDGVAGGGQKVDSFGVGFGFRLFKTFDDFGAASVEPDGDRRGVIRTDVENDAHLV